MSRFKVELGKDHGRARIVIKDRGEVVGMMNISMVAYEQLLREIVALTLETSRKSLSANLGAMIWHDAQNLCEGDAEAAKQKLKSMGWTQEKVYAFAENLARHLAGIVANMMPEIV